jgi:hypothetical protein
MFDTAAGGSVTTRGLPLESPKFHHRLNTDGTIDSICLRCFLTAVRGHIGSDLQELEAAHKCYNKESFILAEYLRQL